MPQNSAGTVHCPRVGAVKTRQTLAPEGAHLILLRGFAPHKRGTRGKPLTFRYKMQVCVECRPLKTVAKNRMPRGA